MSNIFDEQTKFETETLKAYKAGKLTPELTPYFRWKEGGAQPSHQEVKTMRAQCSTAQEKLWDSSHPGDQLADYLDYIADELLRIDLMYTNGVID